jgi:TM2 domain-containing membrane protein YozV
LIYCEPCLSARLGIGGPAAAVPPGVPAMGGPSPALAFILGFIPGVGAMYNGQFIKGLIHVLVFIILIGITNQVGIFGIAIAAWIAYQVFDAFETAKARREGRPLPDPFGLNDFGARIGIPPHGPSVAGAGYAVPGVAQGFTGDQVPPPAGYAEPYAPYGADVPPMPPPPGPGGWRRREPIGAIILIGLGVLFLLNTLNVFNFDWFRHLWPLLIIGFGVALFLRRAREVPPSSPPPPATPPPPPPSAPEAN